MSNSKTLREQRAKLVNDAQAILRQNEITAADRAKFDRMMNDAEDLKGQIDKMETRAAVDADLAAGRYSAVDRYDARYESAAERSVHRDFNNYLRTGDVSPEL